MQTNGQEQQQAPKHVYREVPASVPGPSQPANQTAEALHPEVEATLDAYLDAVCALAPKDVPATAMQDMRREMRDHLQAAIAANAELGATPDAAVATALQQFGKPGYVAQQWRSEWEKTLAATTSGRLESSLKVALKVWGGSDIVTTLLCLLLPILTLSASVSPLRSALILTIFFAPPLISGALIGVRSRRYPVLFALIGRILMLPLIMLGFIGVNAWSQCYSYLVTGKPLFPASAASMDLSVQGVMSFIPLWIVLSLFSSGTTAIGRRLQARARRKIAG